MSKPRLEEIISRALAKRNAMSLHETDLVRLIDGAGDGLPGHYLESYGHAWLLSTSGTRPDPFVRQILARQGRPLYGKRLDQHQKDSPVHLDGPPVPDFFTGLENGLKARLSFSSGYSQGIFIDQRDNRARLRELVRPGQTVLNTFAYTGFFSIAAASAGAVTTTLDLSQVYLDWARDNFRLNDLDPSDHYFCKGDTFHWLRRFAKQGRTFDFLILDPPTFSRDDKGRVFRVEKDYAELFDLAASCIAPGGRLLACTNYRGMSLQTFLKQLPAQKVTPAPMPPDFTDTPYLKSVWVEL